jgi:hypothetical protein
MSVRALLAVWSLALLAAAGSVALVLASDRPWSPSTIALEVLVGLVFVAGGLVGEGAATREPHRVADDPRRPELVRWRAAGLRRVAALHRRLRRRCGNRCGPGPALFYEAEGRTPLGGATIVAGPTGASGTGSNVVRHTDLSTGYSGSCRRRRRVALL